MTQRPQSLEVMINKVGKLRNEMPIFDPSNGGNKNKIDRQHNKIHQLILDIAAFVQVDYAKALEYVDTELEMAGRRKFYEDKEKADKIAKLAEGSN